MSVSDASRSLLAKLSFNHPSVVLTADVFQFLIKYSLYKCHKLYFHFVANRELVLRGMMRRHRATIPLNVRDSILTMPHSLGRNGQGDPLCR